MCVAGLDFGILAADAALLLSLWLHLGPVLHQQTVRQSGLPLSSPDRSRGSLQDKDGLN